ncbi:hypothetical protein LBMAG33_3830 [Candidatus Levyibacteriota bacterium]|nr:single-stranded DNA-binding protein [Candidatus Levybacteria bacterium]MSU25985.1 single-stranded DNA-binding protein [Candidatus Levybacteria bacterium]GDX62073.1 hypothetical protein LBMAG33_3830 [Candidatus Levybacteria bacterium]
MAKSLNKVQLIGNLTRDPELRYTPTGKAVCSFSIATNRNWTTEDGEKHEEVEYHRIVAWGKLSELCSQYLAKGRKVYVEGRLTTRTWTSQDGQQKNATEIIIEDMVLLDSRRPEDAGEVESQGVNSSSQVVSEEIKNDKTNLSKSKVELKEGKVAPSRNEDVVPDDIPF